MQDKSFLLDSLFHVRTDSLALKQNLLFHNLQAVKLLIKQSSSFTNLLDIFQRCVCVMFHFASPQISSIILDDILPQLFSNREFNQNFNALGTDVELLVNSEEFLRKNQYSITEGYSSFHPLIAQHCFFMLEVLNSGSLSGTTYNYVHKYIISCENAVQLIELFGFLLRKSHNFAVQLTNYIKTNFQNSLNEILNLHHSSRNLSYVVDIVLRYARNSPQNSGQYQRIISSHFIGISQQAGKILIKDYLDNMFHLLNNISYQEIDSISFIFRHIFQINTYKLTDIQSKLTTSCVPFKSLYFTNLFDMKMIFNTGCNNETHLAMESDMTQLEEYIYKLPAIPNFNLFGKFQLIDSDIPLVSQSRLQLIKNNEYKLIGNVRIQILYYNFVLLFAIKKVESLNLLFQQTSKPGNVEFLRGICESKQFSSQIGELLTNMTNCTFSSFRYRLLTAIELLETNISENV